MNCTHRSGTVNSLVLGLLSLCVLLGPVGAQEPANTVSLENKSGQIALVKLVGPTSATTEIPGGEARTVHVNRGEYYVLVRYGDDSRSYRFSKGDPFTVDETPTQASATTIVLQEIAGGNYSTRASTQVEFESASGGSSSPNIATAPATVNIRTYPFAPGSTELRADKKGFIIEGGDFPDELLGAELGPSFRSRGLSLSNDFKATQKNEPTEYKVAVDDQGFDPPRIYMLADRGLVTLTLSNRGTVAHRAAGPAFGSRSTIVLSGDDITLPPPVKAFPTVVVTAGSMINIADDKVYSGFYVQLNPGGVVHLTFDGPSRNGWTAVEFHCDLRGHEGEKLSLTGTVAR